MKQSDINWLKVVIRASGVGTKIQREAIIQRIVNQHEQNKETRKRLRKEARRLKREMIL